MSARGARRLAADHRLAEPIAQEADLVQLLFAQVAVALADILHRVIQPGLLLLEVGLDTPHRRMWLNSSSRAWSNEVGPAVVRFTFFLLLVVIHFP